MGGPDSSGIHDLAGRDLMSRKSFADRRENNYGRSVSGSVSSGDSQACHRTAAIACILTASDRRRCCDKRALEPRMCLENLHRRPVHIRAVIGLSRMLWVGLPAMRTLTVREEDLRLTLSVVRDFHPPR